METNKRKDEVQTKQIRSRSCPQCEDDRVSTSIHDYEYVYGSGEAAVKLDVKIPVHECMQCDLQYTDWEAEEIKHNALCRHFGVLNPTQIKQLRQQHGMPRSAFAQLTGLGEASLNRWEKGINIQNVAHDRYLRLLDDPTILHQLKRTVSSIEMQKLGVPDNVIPFRHLKNRKKLLEEQRGFKLRIAN